MGDPKFTKGPLIYSKDETSIIYFFDGLKGTTCQRVNAEADGHLYAAAPDLYAAMEEILFQDKQHSDSQRVLRCKLIEGILRKARGEC